MLYADAKPRNNSINTKTTKLLRSDFTGGSAYFSERLRLSAKIVKDSNKGLLVTTRSRS